MHTTMQLCHSAPQRTLHAPKARRAPPFTTAPGRRTLHVGPLCRVVTCAAAHAAQEEGSDTEDDAPLSAQQQEQLDALAASLVQRAAEFATASDIGAAACVLSWAAVIFSRSIVLLSVLVHWHATATQVGQGAGTGRRLGA